jgi:acetyltransferase-like isoleucine patch superfamily enzyme
LFLGNSVNIHRYAFIFCDAHPQRPGVVEIGNDTYIGHNVHIVAANRVSIGKNVLIADRVFISDCSHGAGDTLSIPPLEREIHSKGPVVIEDNVWIGENAVILPNVRVGTGAVVGANSVVTCNVAPFVAVAGVPARVIMVGKK